MKRNASGPQGNYHGNDYSGRLWEVGDADRSEYPNFLYSFDPALLPASQLFSSFSDSVLLSASYSAQDDC